MSKEEALYVQIDRATQNGHDAEVRRDKEGKFVVFSVKKQKQTMVVPGK